MKNIEDTKAPYEILIRFRDGVPCGAHAQYIRRVTIDGELLKEEILDPVPIDLSGFPTSDIMTDATRDALAEIGRLNGELAHSNAWLDKTMSLYRAQIDADYPSDQFDRVFDESGYLIAASPK